ncbi:MULTISPECIES: hypothetical protein [unclassified Microcoleus]|uniref:hypothetical protein n=1 Tax=unclassified Microcoleus TaxID=2642155 RepID=UPI002FD4ADFD
MTVIVQIKYFLVVLNTRPTSYELPPQRPTYYYDQLLNGGSQHLCQSAEKTICRGGRTIQLRWFCLIGIIEKPTDEAFNQAVVEITSKSHEQNSQNN